MTVSQVTFVHPPPPNSAVTPGGYDIILEALDPLQVKCTVTPSADCDFVFLFDTTGSMGPFLTNAQLTATTLLNRLRKECPLSEFAVVSYRDYGDGPFLYTRHNDLDANIGLSVASIGTLTASGGGDYPEAAYDALYKIAGGAGSLPTEVINFRPFSKRVVILFTDAPSHSTPPDVGYVSLTQVNNALSDNFIVPIVSVRPSEIPFWTSFAVPLGGVVFPLGASAAAIATGVVNAINIVLATINAIIVQTQSYIQNVFPTSALVAPNSVTPVDFLVNLLDDGTGPGLPEANAYINFPGFGKCIINVPKVVRINCDCAELIKINFEHDCGSINCPHPDCDIYGIYGVTSPFLPISILITSITDMDTMLPSLDASIWKASYVRYCYCDVKFCCCNDKKRIKICFTATDAKGNKCHKCIKKYLPLW